MATYSTNVTQKILKRVEVLSLVTGNYTNFPIFSTSLGEVAKIILLDASVNIFQNGSIASIDVFDNDLNSVLFSIFSGASTPALSPAKTLYKTPSGVESDNIYIPPNCSVRLTGSVGPSTTMTVRTMAKSEINTP